MRKRLHIPDAQPVYRGRDAKLDRNAAVFQRYRDGASMTRIAKEFNLSVQTVSRILARFLLQPARVAK